MINNNTKYDWSKVPKHINWIAIDECGLKTYFPRKPEKDNLYNEWYPVNCIGEVVGQEFYQGDWRDSLERRPLSIKD
ncbi:hypothetical protein KPE71_13830 [Acinetobacter soli]|uniref:hypothetical protein n=1 Tax=Acinetobacter soli TaxID=487316 RepID=UPI001C0B6361|nr:hypothetical protein [Acinetobacter soli]MBU3121333.1 hypothetical protein [Acinetobacter soli]